MKNSNLHRFIEKVMTIDTGYPGIGSASAAIIGSTGTNGDMTQDLQKNAIAFATEYSKDASDTNALRELSQLLQGSFLALKMTNSISDNKLEELSSELEALLSSHIQ